MHSLPNHHLQIVMGHLGNLFLSYRGGDLRSMLDGNKDALKLEAMKILIGVLLAL